MDQLKEFVRQAIKYRFWIAIGISALLPMIAYFVGSSKIRNEATRLASDIQEADKAVKGYAGGVVPNHQYKPIVQKETDELTTDVNAAWKKLHGRQGPLLTWPSPDLQEKFQQWGRKWPEGVDPRDVQLVINRYINVYDDCVTEVYQKCRPWDPMEGTGLVVAPPKEGLLQPYPFKEEEPPNDLGLIWAAQEKLWVERAMLEVVDKVNQNSKAAEWDSAPIKQIIELQVANASALDQVSIAKGETLQPAPKLTAGGESGDAGASKPAAAAATEAAAATTAPGSDPSYETMGAAARMPGMYGSGGMLGGADAVSVSYLSSSNNQYQVVPVSMSVLIDQNAINDFLVELANSPMSIQVIDYEQSRPATRITKPVKGENLSMFAGGFMGGMYGGRRGMMEGMFNAQMGGMPGMEGYGGGYGGRMAAAGEGMMPGSFAGGGMYGPSSTPSRTGKSLRDRNLAKEQEEKKKARQSVEVKIHDPYFNIIEVTIYGQARFYNTPPPAEPVESASLAEGATEETSKEAPAAAETKAAPADAAKAEAKSAEAEAPKAEGEADAAKNKAETPKAEVEATTPKR